MFLLVLCFIHGCILELTSYITFHQCHSSKTKKGIVDTREWKHKRGKFSFNQQKNVRNVTWNTGCFTRKLEILAKGCKRDFLGEKTAIAHAKYILDMRQKNLLVRPSKRKSFFPFEEDLIHHIDDALMICSTGVTLSFFGNPFVRNWLMHLEPRHRPIYRLKLTRAIRCIQDVLQSEVS